MFGYACFRSSRLGWLSPVESQPIISDVSLTPATMTTRGVHVGSSKGPISSIPSITLPLVCVNGSDLCGFRVVDIKRSTHVVTVWRRGKSKVKRILGNTPPETLHESIRPTPLPAIRIPTRPSAHLTPPVTLSPRMQPPYDVAEMIIAHLTHDLRTLKACSLTCRSFCIAAAPHLYHTLTFTGGRPEINRSRLEPLSKLHELGLIPLVREIRVKQRDGSSPWFVPHAFSRLDLCHFSAFENIHTLKIQNMEVYRFIPDIGRYFGHLLPTLRSIMLYDPCCTPRQLSYFLSFFANLDDINITIESAVTNVPDTATPVTELVPLSAPKLQGRLALYEFSWIETWTHLITSCGGLQFRHMDLRGSAYCTPLLFEACAETLETLRFHVNDGSVSK